MNNYADKVKVEAIKYFKTIETIKFLNWFSSYNLVPIGLCLKLHLLSGEAITKFDYREYEIFNKKKEI